MADDHHKGGRLGISVIAAVAILFLTSVSGVNEPVKTLQPSLAVMPPTGVAFSGPQGGPFSPSFFQYRLSASTGTVNYSIRTPFWLTARPTFGSAGTTGITITLSVSATASRLPPGAYGPSIAFTNVTNGQGSTTRPAMLVVQGGYLLDSRRGYLLDDDGGRLLPW
jgi:hypothetical protein